MLNSTPAALVRTVKIAALCVAAAALNCIIYPLLISGLKLPLYADTVFTAVITFSFGLIPGLVTALLTWVIGFTIKDDIIKPFILCSIAEVIIIFLLKPAVTNRQGLFSEERKRAVFVSTLARLMLLYIIACVAISVLGGLIDYIFYTVMQYNKPIFSSENVFKEWLLQGPVPVPVMNILSRIPVNLVDRFIVIFGGYFISRAVIKLKLFHWTGGPR